MTTLNTSSERVAELMRASDQIYPILEQKEYREIRARRILRLGIASIAVALRQGESQSAAGSRFDERLSYELNSVDFGAYESYRTKTVASPAETDVPQDIGRLANNYGGILRMTCLADRSREPDSIHALHLTALAVPYARAHYPDLDVGKVALYGPLHDLLEAYTGDVPTFAITPEGLNRKKQQEENAHRLLELQYGHRWPELVATVEAYESLADDEAAFVKALDKNDPGYTHFRNDGYALKHHHGMRSASEFRSQADHNTARTLPYAGRFPAVLADKRELTARIANLFEQENPADTIGG